MVVTIHTQHFQLTPALRRFALENLQEPLERIWDKQGAHLDIHLRDLRGTKGGVDKECRCILHTGAAGSKVVITEVTEDMRKSIHQARKRLMRRARQLSQRLDGPRWPRKQYAAKAIQTGLVRNPTRIVRSEAVHGGRETLS